MLDEACPCSLCIILCFNMLFLYSTLPNYGTNIKYKCSPNIKLLNTYKYSFPWVHICSSWPFWPDMWQVCPWKFTQDHMALPLKTQAGHHSPFNHTLSPTTFCHLAWPLKPVTCCSHKLLHTVTVVMIRLPSAWSCKLNDGNSFRFFDVTAERRVEESCDLKCALLNVLHFRSDSLRKLFCHVKCTWLTLKIYQKTLEYGQNVAGNS